MVPVELSSLKQTSTIKLRLDELGWLRLENLQWGWGYEACLKLDLIWYFVFLELLICCSCYYLFQLESRGLPVSTLNNALSLCLSSSPQSPAEQSFTAWWRHLKTQLQVCHLSLHTSGGISFPLEIVKYIFFMTDRSREHWRLWADKKLILRILLDLDFCLSCLHDIFVLKYI